MVSSTILVMMNGLTVTTTDGSGLEVHIRRDVSGKINGLFHDYGYENPYGDDELIMYDEIYSSDGERLDHIYCFERKQ